MPRITPGAPPASRIGQDRPPKNREFKAVRPEVPHGLKPSLTKQLSSSIMKVQGREPHAVPMHAARNRCSFTAGGG